MAADWTWKQGDSYPAVTDKLVNADGSTPTLAGTTLKLTIRSQTSASPVATTGTASILDATTGTVQYAPSQADTQTPGLYMATWHVTFANGSQATYPPVGYKWISIEENLTTTGGQLLVGLPDVKDYLNVNTSDRAQDAKLIRFIHAARPIVERITGPVIPQVFDEKYEGGNNIITLSHRPSVGYGTSPILNVMAVSEYVGPTEYPLVGVQDAALGSTYSYETNVRLGTITRRTSGGGTIAFPPGENTVHVVYEAGQATVPQNVYEGMLELLRVNYQTTQATGRGAMSLADAEDQPGPSLGFFVPRRVHELLSPTRRAPAIA